MGANRSSKSVSAGEKPNCTEATGQPNKKCTDSAMSSRMVTLMNMPVVSKEKQLEHAWWYPFNYSQNISITGDCGLTILRHESIESVDYVQGRTGFTSGLHMWHLHLEQEHRGRHPAVGVSTRVEYSHGKSHTCNRDFYPCHEESEIKWSGIDSSYELIIVLDIDQGTLGYIADGQYKGFCCHSLKGKELFPMVAVFIDAEITMRYLGGLETDPSTL